MRELASRQQLELRIDDTGIGLALVERLVEQLGGEVTVRSTLGRGTSVVVRVPCVLPEPQAVEAEEGAVEEVPRSAGALVPAATHA